LVIGALLLAEPMAEAVFSLETKHLILPASTPLQALLRMVLLRKPSNFDIQQ